MPCTAHWCLRSTHAWCLVVVIDMSRNHLIGISWVSEWCATADALSIAQQQRRPLCNDMRLWHKTRFILTQTNNMHTLPSIYIYILMHWMAPWWIDFETSLLAEDSLFYTHSIRCTITQKRIIRRQQTQIPNHIDSQPKASQSMEVHRSSTNGKPIVVVKCARRIVCRLVFVSLRRAHFVNGFLLDIIMIDVDHWLNIWMLPTHLFALNL